MNSFWEKIIHRNGSYFEHLKCLQSERFRKLPYKNLTFCMVDLSVSDLSPVLDDSNWINHLPDDD